MSLAAKLIRDHLNIFINLEEGAEQQAEAGGDQPRTGVSNENLDKSVEELELSVRSYNCLKNANIRTIRELVQKTEGRDAQDEELRAQEPERDQGNPAHDGAEPRHARRPASVGERRNSTNSETPSRTSKAGTRHRASHLDAAEPGDGAAALRAPDDDGAEARRSCGRSSSASSPSPSAASPTARPNGKALNARRLVSCTDLQDREVVGKLFDTLAPRFAVARRAATRACCASASARATAAEIAQVELVGSEFNPEAKSKADGRASREAEGEGRRRATARRRRSGCGAEGSRARGRGRQAEEEGGR